MPRNYVLEYAKKILTALRSEVSYNNIIINNTCSKQNAFQTKNVKYPSFH